MSWSVPASATAVWATAPPCQNQLTDRAMLDTIRASLGRSNWQRVTG